MVCIIEAEWRIYAQWTIHHWSDNGLSPDRRQAIVLTIAGTLLIGHPGTKFNEILIEIRIFSFKKIHFKMSSGKWRLSCVGLTLLTFANGKLGNVNSLWCSYTIWWHRSVWTLAQVMAWSLATPLPEPMLTFINNGVLWHSSKTNFTGSVQDSN